MSKRKPTVEQLRLNIRSTQALIIGIKKRWREGVREPSDAAVLENLRHKAMEFRDQIRQIELAEPRGQGADHRLT